jgi:hypothetical protein
MALLGFLGIFASIWVTKFSSRLKSQRRLNLDSELLYLKRYLAENIHCSDTLARARNLHGKSANSEICAPGNNMFFPIYRSTFEGPALPLGSLGAGVQNSSKVGDWWVRGQCLWDLNNPNRTTLIIRAARPKVAPGASGFHTDPINTSRVLDWNNDKLILFGDPTQDSTLEPICEDIIPQLSGGSNRTLLGFNVGMLSTRTRLENLELDKIYTWLNDQCQVIYVNPLVAEKNYLQGLSNRTAAQNNRLNALKGNDGLIKQAKNKCESDEKSYRGPKNLAGFQRQNPTVVQINNNTVRASSPQYWGPESNYVDFDLPTGTSFVELDVSGQWQGKDDYGVDVASTIITIEISSSTSHPGKYYGNQMIKIGSDRKKSRSVRFTPTKIGLDIPSSNILTFKDSEQQWSSVDTSWTNDKFHLPKVECLTSLPCTKIRYYERIPNHSNIPLKRSDINNSTNDGKAYWWSTVTAKFFGS